jgi:hypothetical protein
MGSPLVLRLSHKQGGRAADFDLRVGGRRLVRWRLVLRVAIDWPGHRSSRPVEVWDRCCKLVTDAIAAGGANLETGKQLPFVFAEAGLPAPSMRITSIVGAGANSRDLVQRMSNLALSLLPVIEDRGLVEPGEFDEETLTQRIADELSASRSFAVAGSEVTAHSHLPRDC